MKELANYDTIINKKGVFSLRYGDYAMAEKGLGITIEQFNDMIQLFYPSMDDYLYILDFKNDFYSISPSALERFLIPAAQFHNATAELQKFIYEDDYPILQEDIKKIVAGLKDEHNLQYRWLDREKRPVWINCRGQIFLDAEGRAEYMIGCVNEIGTMQKADNISGLLREYSLQREMSSIAERMEGYMLRIGIDDFKGINENKGLSYGDMILRRTAECIESVISKEQKLYRAMADEFIVVDYAGSKEEAQKLYKRVREKIDGFIEENQYEVFFTVSAGILMLQDVNTQEFYNLMKLSEFALNQAKESGKNKYYVYVHADYRAFLDRRELIYILRRSVNNGFEGFEAYFQPIVDVGSGKLYMAETLLRFSSQETGMVSPGEFIPLLEESGLIIPVGKWVMHQAMAACCEIQKSIPDFKVTVNLSYIQVLKSNVLLEILEALNKYGLTSESIVIELTESGFLEADENFISFCNGLQKNGIPLALDDFGTGYSNFHYLYNLKPSTIKIDRSFTLKALSSDYEYNLLRHMVEMTHSISLKLCIEGIETKQELDKISEMGPDYIQGYFFGKPCPLPQFLSEYVQK